MRRMIVILALLATRLCRGGRLPGIGAEELESEAGGDRSLVSEEQPGPYSGLIMTALSVRIVAASSASRP
jgi:hypothetical protein